MTHAESTIIAHTRSPEETTAVRDALVLAGVSMMITFQVMGTGAVFQVAECLRQEALAVLRAERHKGLMVEIYG